MTKRRSSGASTERTQNDILWESQHGQCAYCGTRMMKENPDRTNKTHPDKLMTVDHLIPTARGGPKTGIKNRCLSCRKCNGEKANLTPEEYFAVIKVRNRKLKIKRPEHLMCFITKEQVDFLIESGEDIMSYLNPDQAYTGPNNWY